MLPQIHIYDLLAIAGGTLLLVRAACYLFRHKAWIKTRRAGVLLLITSFSCWLWAHIWAQVRPLAVEVEVLRHWTADELKNVRSRMNPHNDPEIDKVLQITSVSEYTPFDHESQPSISRADLARIRFQLAWGSFLPRFPKVIIIRSRDDAGRVEALYNWRELRQTKIHFQRQGDDWNFSTSNQFACGTPTTNKWEKFLNYSPIDFRGYNKTF